MRSLKKNPNSFHKHYSFCKKFIFSPGGNLVVASVFSTETELPFTGRGAHAVVLRRCSRLGSPWAQLMLLATKALPSILRREDLLLWLARCTTTWRVENSSYDLRKRAALVMLAGNALSQELAIEPTYVPTYIST